ncbi:MAG: NAD(P)-dependent alcohol dehydrogenase [Halieaceae bacterium]|nr:NAD(P)-dependent alcohol dehydrogenase [Halieaceae bacterium]
MKIKAAVARTVSGNFSIEDVDLADPRDEELLVKIVATGICHTDLSVVSQILPLPLPQVLGHEGAGIVERVGSDVKGIEPGDHVVLSFNYCGGCAPCTAQHLAYCDQYWFLNFNAGSTDGSATHKDANGERLGGAFLSQSSFATYALTHQRNTIKVRKDAPLELLGPLGCGLTTGAGTVLNVLKPGPETTIAIFGTGAIGMSALLAARNLDAGRIIAVDRVESRLELALELGATEVVNTAEQDLAAALEAVGGIDQGIESTGVPPVISTAADALKVRGTLALLGLSNVPQVTLNILPLISGKTIRGVAHGDCNPSVLIPQLVDSYLEGKFPMDRLSAFYPFEQINKAVADTNSGKTIKPILRMESEH